MPSSGYHIWSGSYQRELTDIFELQDELAKVRHSGAANRAGSGRHSKRLVPEQTLSLEAYNWFIRGRALFDWANPEKVIQQSVSYFEKAVEADPDYAPWPGDHLACRPYDHDAVMASVLRKVGPVDH